MPVGEHAHEIRVTSRFDANGRIGTEQAAVTAVGMQHDATARRLCDLALLVGFAEEQQTLSAAHFEAVCRELVAVVPE